MARKVLSGKVLKKSGDKTISVEVSRVVFHPLYKKKIIRKKKYLVHDASDVAKIGLNVRIEESAPISKNKKWKLITN